MRRRRKSRQFSRGLVEDENQQNLISRWILKVLLELDGWKKLEISSNGFAYYSEILAAVGLEHLEDDEMNKNHLLETLQNQQESFAGKPASPNQHLIRNSKEIADYIGLNDVERQILTFTVLLKENEGLQEATGILGDVNVEAVTVILATILELDLQDTRTALSRQGLLARAGLLTIDRECRYPISEKLDLMEGLGEALQEADITIETMLQHYFNLVGPPELTRGNYRHVEDHYSIIYDHLQLACTQQTKGVNILIYGQPGTGKTEFAKTVARNLGYNLYEVNIGGEDKPFDKSKRLRAFQLAQQVLSRQKDALILFDEIDSLLTDSFSFFQDGKSLNLKASINRNLENGLVPSIWIANDIYLAESAFIRRFDVVFHMDIPPRSTRLEILENYLKDIPVSCEWMGLLADNKFIAPAVVARAAKVLRGQEIKETAEIEKKLEKLLESTQTAMGYPRRPLIEKRVQINYRLGAVNSDHNLKEIVQGLQKHSEGRLCLYGPPGTGKTEFGHYLAKELDKPLLIKRSSDLLSPYLGEAEQNIAKMFYEATYEKSVLLLDEADGFLRDRRKAQRSWEVTQVNELLTQMERYEGIFVCSTNLMDNLDPASLRRFDLKIKFDFLKPEQAWDLFETIFTERKVKLKRKKHWLNELEKQRSLTPGDFATVIRKSRISGTELTPETMITGLNEEVAFKNSEAGRNIGFFVP